MTALCPCCMQPVPDNKVLIDYASNTVTYNGVMLFGTSNEIDLLGLLLVQMPRVLVHDRIITAIWGDHDPINADKCIHVMICALRKKLTPEMGLRIDTVYRRGYRLVPVDTQLRRVA